MAVASKKASGVRLKWLSQIAEQVNDSIVVTNIDNKIVYVNQATIKLFGYPQEELIGKTPSIFDAEQVSPELLKQIHKTVTSGKTFTGQITNKRKNGSTFICELKVAPMYSPDGLITGTIGVQRDITEQKLLEESLKLRSQLLDNASDLIFLHAHNPDENLMYVNEMMCLTLGYSREELLNMNMKRIVAPEIHSRFPQHHQALDESGVINFESSWVHKDGSIVPVEVNTRLVEVGGRQLVLSSARNISERKRAEEELRLRSHLIDNASDIIFLRNFDSRHILYANESMCRMLGYSREEMENIEFGRLLTEEGKNSMPQRAQKLYDSGHDIFESMYVRKDGSLLPLEVNLRLIEFNNQKFILTSAHDITGRKMAEQILKESEAKFRTLAELSPNMIFINKKGRIVYANEKCETIMGYKKEELYRDEFDFLTLIVPEHRNLVKASFSKHMNGEEVIPIEYALVTKDGRRIEVIHSTTLIVYENDTAILGTLTDITDRKKAEEELRESENKYRIITENSLTGIFIEQDEKFVYVNEKFARMHGYEPEELLGKEHWALIPPNDKEIVKDRVIKRHKGEPVSLVFQRPRIKRDGSVIWAQQIMVAIEYHGKPAIMGNIVDITEVKEATEKRLTALKSTIEAIALTSETRDPYTAGHQHHVAELACAIAREMNLPKEQIEGVRLAGVVHDIGKMYVPAEILSKPGQLSEAEFNMIKMHAKAGYDILKNIDFPWPIAQAVLQHHLRLDGSGYPECEKGKEIIIEARILTVADVIEAMASHRPYRPALGIDKALDEIAQNRGKLYDPDVVDACLRLFNEKEFKL